MFRVWQRMRRQRSSGNYEKQKPTRSTIYTAGVWPDNRGRKTLSCWLRVHPDWQGDNNNWEVFAVCEHGEIRLILYLGQQLQVIKDDLQCWRSEIQKSFKCQVRCPCGWQWTQTAARVALPLLVVYLHRSRDPTTHPPPQCIASHIAFPPNNNINNSTKTLSI